MRRETGKTDSGAAHGKVSIRLRSDGHSFPELPASGDALEAVILGRKTTLVPVSEFQAELADRYLAACGLGCSASEQAVWSEPAEGRVAVMAVDRTITERLPRSVHFSSPLLRSVPPRSVILEHCEGLLFLSVALDGGIVFAEVLRASSDADTLYYLTGLERCFPLKTLTIRLVGEESISLRWVLKSRYKRIVCE